MAGHRTALSINRDFDTTIVRLYLARSPLLRAVLGADKMAGLGCKRLTSRNASKSLKVIFESAVFFIR